MRQRRAGTSGDIYRLRLKTVAGIPLLLNPSVCKKVIESLKWCCEKRGLKIYDYVLMADRLVMICRPGWAELSDVSDSFRVFTSNAVLRLLRSGRGGRRTARVLADLKEYGQFAGAEGVMIWEKPDSRRLTGMEEVNRCAVLMHSMPVKAGWVSKPAHYCYSSAHENHPLDGWVVEATDRWH
jgi:putative transposase